MTDHAGTAREAAATATLPDSVTKFAPELAQLVVVMLWASTFILSKAAFAEVSPLAFVFVRFLLMVVLAFAVMVIKERGESWWIARADLERLMLAGLTGYTLYQLGFVLGLNRTSVFSSALLWTMIPSSPCSFWRSSASQRRFRAGPGWARHSLGSRSFSSTSVTPRPVRSWEIS